MEYLFEALKFNKTLIYFYFDRNNYINRELIDKINLKIWENRMYRKDRKEQNQQLLKIPLYLNKSSIFISRDIQNDFKIFLSNII